MARETIGIGLVFPEGPHEVSPYGTLPGDHTEHASVRNSEIEVEIDRVKAGISRLLHEILVTSLRRTSEEEFASVNAAVMSYIAEKAGEDMSEQYVFMLRLFDNLDMNLPMENGVGCLDQLRDTLRTRNNPTVSLISNHFDNMSRDSQM